MTMHTRVSGTWREVAPSVRAGGVWRAIQNGYVRVAGAWREFYTAFFISINNLSFTYFGTPAEYHINSDGNIYTRSSSTLTNRGPWISDPALVGQYEARVIATSGSFQAGSAPENTWLNLGTTRTWSRGAPIGGSAEVTFTVEIRRASDDVVMDTATITMGVVR